MKKNKDRRRARPPPGSLLSPLSLPLSPVRVFQPRHRLPVQGHVRHGVHPGEHQVDGRVHVAYSTAKSGLVGFTRSTAMAYVKKGIRCNLVIVGTMHTPLVEERLVKQLGPEAGANLVAKRHAAVPIGRMGDAWDTAHAVLFLASDEARYITATHLVVDGGLTAARPG